MSISRSRLDRFLAKQTCHNKKSVRLLLAQKRVEVDGEVATCMEQIIDKFSVVSLDGKVLQQNTAIYLMLHKPVGVVCATKDEQHKTVIDLLQHPDKASLHIVGRLDLNTSGLVLLTNDSRWSEALTLPENKIEKQYLVTLAKPITADYISAFADGMHFSYENIITKPAKLKIINEYQAEVALVEGKYHQIKRMFGRFRNPVAALHRYAIGHLHLDQALHEGESRLLTEKEVVNIFAR